MLLFCLPFFNFQKDEQQQQQQEISIEHINHLDELEPLLNHNLSRWDLLLSWILDHVSNMKKILVDHHLENETCTTSLPEIDPDHLAILNDMTPSKRNTHGPLNSKIKKQVIPAQIDNSRVVPTNQFKVKSTQPSRPQFELNIQQNTHLVESSIKNHNRTSLPSLISDTTETVESYTPSLPSTSYSSVYPLDSESIRFIHQTYNHRCIKHFGNDLSSAQIHQIHQHIGPLSLNRK